MFHRLNNRAPNLLHIFLHALSISSQIIANSLLILLAACISYSFINSSNIFAKRYHFWTLDFLLLSRREFGKMTATLSDEIDAVFNLKNVKKNCHPLVADDRRSKQGWCYGNDSDNRSLCKTIVSTLSKYLHYNVYTCRKCWTNTLCPTTIFTMYSQLQ